ncbi:DEAD/DEAH box helicase [Enterococcus cecorum]|uniref:DEAD-box ATP-dependent RNA helicase CshA n=1 Tax=Enterococcus cecorum DSM 20682 = ATCC 43198 TaxID=1121864 RepID=S1QU03_9ENTE|nr:DEAD/DEAH box helicase [Enterococcus cecorum]EOX17281.1 DEAD/DEAH box helicase [Enterococcus cecorum DSM 20682 = ATCC 43198]ESK60451.1 DEAD/DEAH box helicase [Enterococcus cecorum DSM 20682 = ATCC 43198]KLN92632.1 DEAD/DEAH box helicase [Enterococcus cecorum]KLN92820.1 DEAD/DEAH box helicase [Enterococcus cecorum]KLO66615.1 DEAD/DEAH box helicase [Enterococcus cecorum]
MKFTELNLSEELLSSIERSGFEEATPIQEATIPLALEGRDVIGQAQTGTGKTAAFGLPMLEKIDPNNAQLQGLVIAPTRELAIQTQEELYRLGRDKKIRVQAVYGGADINRQIRQLKNRPHIVVGTPGRMLDHINRHTLKLSTVQTLVLDEADEMLNMGFLEDIEAIISKVPEQRQTLLFSATMPPEIKNIGVQFMQNPEHVRIKTKEMTADLIEQFFVRAKEYEKFDIMTRLLDVQIPELTIVFGRTKRRVDELAKGLEARGYKAEGIHGDLSQQKRMSVLRSFKNGDLDILVATDVAARGLDISGVTHVYNYDIPQDPESYVHRIGRTGRAGKMGVSVTFVTPNEMSYLHVIENLTKKRMTPLRPPTEKEAFKGQLGQAMEEIEAKMDENGLERYMQAAEELLEEYSAQDLAALLVKTIAKDPADMVPVKITPERPLPPSKKGFNKNNRRGGNSRNRRDYNRDGKYGRNKKDYGKDKRRENRKNNKSEKKRGFVIRSNH